MYSTQKVSITINILPDISNYLLSLYSIFPYFHAFNQTEPVHSQMDTKQNDSRDLLLNGLRGGATGGQGRGSCSCCKIAPPLPLFESALV